MPVRRIVLVAALVLLLGGGSLLLLTGGGPSPDEDIHPLGEEAPARFAGMTRGALEARAARGHAQPLFARSPGGAAATARRTGRWRDEIERVATRFGVDANLLEAMVFLESAGRPDAIAGGDLEGAAGLAQILAATGRDFLGMRVDLRASRRLTRRIRRAEERGERGRAERLRAERARVDQRFDPRAALAGAGRYLQRARERFGRADLATVSYHMGIGNLDGVLRAFAGDEAEPDDAISEVVEGQGLSYARVFFESAPDRHAAAWRRLGRLGDDSSTYLWRVLAARRIMRLRREDAGELERLERLHGAKASAEEVLHPRADAESFADPPALHRAYDEGRLRRFEPGAGEPLRADRRMGRHAGRLGEPRSLYSGLRPEALALAEFVGAEARRLSGGRSALTVSSTVRDRRYQRLLTRVNPQATRGHSLHTTGFALDVLRRYSSDRQAVAFQHLLDRLQSLNLIAWAREPEVIHLTASREAGELR